MITARHWVRTSLGDSFWPLKLHDGAQAVQIDSANWATWEESTAMGIAVLRPVCCGPAAPLPDRWEMR